MRFGDNTDRIEAAEKLKDRAITVEEITGTQNNWSKAAEAFIRGFEEALNLEFLESYLTAGEIKRAKELKREKYSNMEWTARV